MIRYIVKYSILTACGVILFLIFNRIADAWRGYDAIGGEGLFVLLPVLWFVVETVIKDVVQLIKTLR